MRILLYSGKGGVGKTSVAAATGVHLASFGHRTLVMSVDPAHSLGDAFDLEAGLFHGSTSRPYRITEHLDIQEVNINEEVKRHWKDVTAYVTAILKTSGLGDVEAEEMAIFPGMEELSAMLYVNEYLGTQTYEVIVLDCAPTAESLRFVSLPTTLDWYMRNIFGFQRRILKAVRPIANRISPVELPPEQYFQNLETLFERIAGIDKVLEDPLMTSVRLVTNAEKMVLRETQRAFVYFSLHGLTVDEIIVNRVLPAEVRDVFFDGWREAQRKTLESIDAYFQPVPVRQVPLFPHEVFGLDRLQLLARHLYPVGEDPSRVSRAGAPYSFTKAEDHYEVRLTLPFAEKGEVGLFKKGDELVVEIGTIRRHVGLPTSMTALVPTKARFDEGILVVEMRSIS
jgi:arsenite/tail-anchored protein-transporting ATPase